jgi:hypothetical protein
VPDLIGGELVVADRPATFFDAPRAAARWIGGGPRDDDGARDDDRPGDDDRARAPPQPPATRAP